MLLVQVHEVKKKYGLEELLAYVNTSDTSNLKNVKFGSKRFVL